MSQMVREALAPVPNPSNNKDIAALNAVRASLSAVARNSSGFSLRQPHLDRTRLCDMNDSQLDPGCDTTHLTVRLDRTAGPYNALRICLFHCSGLNSSR